MTTATKLLLGFGTLTALLLLFSAALTIRLRSIENSVEEQANVARPRADETRQITISVLGFALAVRTFGQTGNPRFQEMAANEAAEVERHLDQYKRLARTGLHQHLASEFTVRWLPFKQMGQRLAVPGVFGPGEWERLAEHRIELERFLDQEMQPEAVETYNSRQSATSGDIEAITTLAVILFVAFVIIAAMTSAIVGQNIIRAERAAHEKGEMLRLTLASIGDAVMTADTSGNVTFLNQVAQDLTGWTQDAAQGQPATTVFKIINESDRLAVESPIGNVLRDGAVVGLANHTLLLTKDGREIPIDDSGAPIKDQKGELRGVILVFRDIRDRQRRDANQMLLLDIAEKVRQSGSTGDLLYAVAHAVGESFAVRRCFFNEIDLENDVETVHRDYCSGTESVSGVHRISEYSPVTSGEMQAGKTVVNSDSKTDARTADFYERTYAPAGERSYVAVPLMREGRWVSSLWMSDDKPRNWDEADVRLAETIAERAWLAVERLRSEAALKESEVRFAKAFNSSPLAVTITSLNTGELIEVNQSFVELTGYSREDAVGKTTAQLGLWKKTDDREKELERVLKDGQIRNSEYAFTMRDGSEIVGLLSAELLELDGEPCALSVIQNITERKQAEEELNRSRADLEGLVLERTVALAQAHKHLEAEGSERLRIEKERVQLLKQVVTTQEDERRRIARDLHDELGQQLTALRLKLKSAREICGEQEVCDEIDETQRIAERLDADVSFLARELRPAALGDTDLPTALGAYVKEWARFTSITAEFHARGLRGLRLAPEIETNMYRIAQEALNNAHKHSMANNVSVILEKHNIEITLIIEDDGVAFNPQTKGNRRKGIGLIGMRERAALLGGKLEIESSKGTGTTIFVRVPDTIIPREEEP